MSDKLSEYINKHEKTKSDYDRLVDEANSLRRQIDNAYTNDEKKIFQTKLDGVIGKMREADKREKDAKRQLDEYMKRRT